jgi:hypothetical protein
MLIEYQNVLEKLMSKTALKTLATSIRTEERKPSTDSRNIIL